MLVSADFDEAQRFLDLLHPNGQFHFQVFAESEGACCRPQILHGTLADHGKTLERLNQAGGGVFVMVNEGTSRRAEGVTRVRALFVDLDGAPLDAVLEVTQPHWVVESSPGRWHAYWRIADCELGQFKPRQQALAARFDGDASVCDLPRVMRLPGFWHHKTSTPFQSRLVDCNLRKSAP